MDWLNRLFGSGGAKGSQGVLWLYARCDRCGAPVAVRVNTYNDLSTDERGGYFLRKEMMDDRCFQLMVAELHFDAGRRIKDKTISGGHFLSAEEYEQLKGQLPATPA